MEILTLIIANLLPIAGAFLMAMVPVFVGVIVFYIRKWTGVQLSGIQRDRLESLSYDAVSFAEEQASKYMKSTGDKLSGDDKMKCAIDFMARQAIELDLPGMAVGAIRDLVEAKLGEGRDNEDA